MNETVKEELIKQRNMYYYNQMLLKNDKPTIAKSMYVNTPQQKNISFASQKIDFKDFLFVPDKWEGVFYTLYALCAPYIAGAVFLFFFVAGGSYENFKLLNMDAFLIIWLIGYEVIAVFALSWIMMLYLRYDSQESAF